MACKTIGNCVTSEPLVRCRWRATLNGMSILDDLLDEARARRSLPPVALRRLLRERAGLTQAELARSLDVDRATVSRWEAGIRAPRGRSWAAYAVLLERLDEETTNSGSQTHSPGPAVPE
jgi:hypothetical protein